METTGPSVSQRQIATATPAERPELARIAEAAGRLLREVVGSLDADDVERLGAQPVEGASADFEAYPRSTEYDRLGRRAIAALMRTRSEGDRWTSLFSRMLKLALLRQLPNRTPELAIPVSCWPFFEQGLQYLLDVLAEQDQGPWDEIVFQKDIGIAQLRLLPDRGMARCAFKANPWFIASEATWRQRTQLVRYLGLAAFRPALFLTGHAWREAFRTARPAGGGKRSTSMTDLVIANPQILGTINSGWPCDPGLKDVTPHLWQREQQFARRGGCSFRMPTRDIDIKNALQASERRRQLYAEGRYQPRVYGRILKRDDFIRATLAEQAAAANRPAADAQSPRT